MALLRKATLVFAEIFLLVVVTVVLVAPENVVELTATVNNFDLTLRIVVAVLIDLLIFVAVISQLRGGTNYRGEALLVQAGDSDTTITTESVRQAVIKAVYAIDDIETVEAEISGKRGDAIIKMEVTTSKDELNVPNKQREIDRAIKRVVVKQMGVKLGKPAVVNIRLASDAKGKKVTPAATPRSAPDPVKLTAEKPPVEKAVAEKPTPAPTAFVESPRAIKQDTLPVSEPETKPGPTAPPSMSPVATKSLTDSMLPASDSDLEPVEPGEAEDEREEEVKDKDSM